MINAFCEGASQHAQRQVMQPQPVALGRAQRSLAAPCSYSKAE